MRATIVIAVAVMSLLNVAAGEDPLSQRAARAFEAGEWPSAQAMYSVIADREPDGVLCHARAIVAAEAVEDSTSALVMARHAMAAAMPPDSLLDVVQRESYRIGKPAIYARVLDGMEHELPYMRRALVLRRLNYCRQRNDDAGVIACAQRLLDGLPDDIRFLTLLADARLNSGQAEEAVNTYMRILQLDPDNIDALTALATYYDTVGDSRASDYYRRAYAVSPTPYVARRISQLTDK